MVFIIIIIINITFLCMKRDQMWLMENNNKRASCCASLGQDNNCITKTAGNSGATEHEHQIKGIQRLVQENQKRDKCSLLTFVFFVLYSCFFVLSNKFSFRYTILTQQQII
uniref:Uncharacterized protein n=1 Tax=Rhipicephalus appendiculatus TaxID=34631 RepID=A0A131YER6_RHIAP